MTRARRAVISAGVALALAATHHASAVAVLAQAATPRTFVTKHTGTFNGQRIGYTATVGETLIADDKGTPTVSFFSIAYVADSTERDRRPVIFAFNGGPGAASVWLHMGALGPKRVALPSDVNAAVVSPYRTIDNPHSPLDVADLVLIDPAETGFSRVLPGGNRQNFYHAANDARAVAQFIHLWVKANAREGSPKFIVGESYGTIRAVLVAEELATLGQPVGLSGVALLGQAVNIVETVQRAGSIVGQAVNLQLLAATGFYHGRADTKGRTLDQHLDEAYTFAMGEYLTALAKGRDLPDEERGRIAQRLSQLTGLPAEYYRLRDLMITKERFREEILRDKGLIVGRYDSRYTGPASANGKPAADPSMKMSPAFDALVKEHLSKTLGVTLTEEYRPTDRAAGAQWDYGGAKSPFTDYDYSGGLARLMRAQPHLHLLIATGIYDTTTTTGAARYFVARSQLPAERVVSRTYEGGHMFYTNEAALEAFARDLRAFVAPPAFTVTVRPLRGADGDPTTIEVRWQLDASPAAQGREKRFSMQAPITYAGVDGIADSLEQIELRDRTGVVPLSITNDAVDPGGYPYFRHWVADRGVSYPVTLAYRAKMHPAGGKPGPPWPLRPSAGAVSAAGSGFLVLPEDAGARTIRFAWDLSGLAPGSAGITSFSEGAFELRGSAGQLMQGWYMAGPVERYPASGDEGGFSASWHGATPFDPQTEMAWTAKMYGYLRSFFRDSGERRYRVFMRALAEPPNRGGTGLTNSFMFVTPTGTRDPSTPGPRGTFAHEMIHQFVGGIEGGRTQTETSWFAEGLTSFYTLLLPTRAGLQSVEEYGRGINNQVRSYFTNPARNMSSEAIGKAFFSNPEARTVPYGRGALYWADLDAKIRIASGGRRTLDDVIFELFDRRTRGERIDQETLVEAFVKELGPSARDTFEAVMIRAETIVPASGAFGPCFERRPAVFETRGTKVDGYEWVRVAAVPDERCRQW